MPTVDVLEDESSREITEGESATFHYDVPRAASELEALGAVQSIAPLSYQGILRGRIRITPEGGGMYRAEVPYALSTAEPTSPEAGQPPAGGSGGAGGANPATELSQEMQFQTAISGGVKFLRSLQTLESGLSFTVGAGPAPDYAGYMNVQPDGTVNGVELPTPDSTFSITRRFPSLTYGWYWSMLDLVWCTNEAPFRGMDINEVAFLGATGNYKGDGWQVTCNFGVQRSLDNIPIDEDLLVVPRKQGWDYLWVSYYDFVTIEVPKVLVKRPMAYYLEQILYVSDFSVLGLG